MTKKQKRSRPEPSVVYFELSDEELEHVSGAMSYSTSTSANFVRASDPLAALRVPQITWGT
jgi:hypothetical protein